MGYKERSKIFLDFIEELKNFYNLKIELPKEEVGSVSVSTERFGINCQVKISDNQDMDINYRYADDHVTVIIGHHARTTYFKVDILKLNLEEFHNILSDTMKRQRKIAVESYIRQSSFLDEIITGLEKLS